MTKATATQVKNSLGKYIDSSKIAPVVIEKSGRNEAVLISFQEFERLSEYEDLYWTMLAKEAAKTGFLGINKTKHTLDKLAKKAGIDIEDDA
jgi:prevent-host-death family protein